MPKQHIVVAPFHFAMGGEVLRFKKGERNLPPEALAHAIKHGFATPKAKPKAAPAQAEPKTKL